uniref:Uncharacterized protein n=1 Tax=Sphaerodactylus townsendi TaxID=933632 RepID=A0ACB8EMG8_9SAUR
MGLWGHLGLPPRAVAAGPVLGSPFTRGPAPPGEQLCAWEGWSADLRGRGQLPASKLVERAASRPILAANQHPGSLSLNALYLAWTRGPWPTLPLESAYLESLSQWPLQPGTPGTLCPLPAISLSTPPLLPPAPNLCILCGVFKKKY